MKQDEEELIRKREFYDGVKMRNFIASCKLEGINISEKDINNPLSLEEVKKKHTKPNKGEDHVILPSKN